ENLQVSYSMIDMPEEEVGITRRKDANAKPKQEPVIKGILPEVPAPAPIVKPAPAPAAMAPAPATSTASASAAAGGGFFAWIRSLFAPQPQPQAAAPVQPLAPAEAISERSGERKPRTGRGARGS